MAARVQLPPAQDVSGRYRSGVTVIGVTDAETEDDVVVYDAPSGGSTITFPSPGVTSGDEGEFDAWTAPNTVSIELDVADDSYDNPKVAELVSWDAIDEAINNIPFTEISGVPGVNVMEAPYNAAGNGSTDDHAAIQAAIEAASAGDPWSGWRVVLPPGQYRISESIVINRRGTHLLGSGRSRSISGSTEIIADDGVRGIIVKHPTGIGGSLGQATADPSDSSRGDDSILENFAIYPSNNSGGTALSIHGICVRNRCTIKHVSVGNGSLGGFNGNGIDMNASVATGNASQSLLYDVRCEGNLKYGIETAGGDSSACLFQNVACDLNGQWGFYESSFLGNTFINCHTRDNGEDDGVSGGYKSVDANSLFLGCYTEGGQPSANQIEAPAMVVRPAGVEANDGDAIQLEGSSDLTNTAGGFTCITGTDLDGDVITVGSAGQASQKFYIGNGVSSDSSAMRLMWDNTAGEYQWLYGTAGSPGTDGVMAWPTPTATRGAAGWLRVDEGILVGPPSTAIAQKRGTAAPGSGTWKRGDIVFNSTPSATGFVGWVCTVAGTPGTWKGFGTIES